MREIVVNDTNILIDMHTAGLLEYIQKSSVRFHTVDFVIDELHRSPYRRPLIDELIQNGVLYVAETSRMKCLRSYRCIRAIQTTQICPSLTALLCTTRKNTITGF